MSPRRSSRPLLRPAAALVGLAMFATGCEFEGLYGVPLPGGQGTGDDAYTVMIEFDDVLNLVPNSSVQVNNVTVGRVADIELDGFTAVVELSLNGDVVLPDNSEGTLRQTSLLGEKFVSLSPPVDGVPQGRLSEGDLIPLAQTGRNPEVEEIFSALSLLLNGGGVQQLQVINRELAAVFAGREDKVRSLLTQLDTFVSGLDQQKSEIVRALDGFDRLSARLAQETDTIELALDEVAPGFEVLERQRADLVTMLQALSEFGEVGTRVVNATQENTVANLRALEPILTRLDEAGEKLPQAFDLLFTYPFPPTARQGVVGDYTNLVVTADLDLRSILLREGVPLPELPGPVLPLPPVQVPPIEVPPPPAAELPDLPLGGSALPPAPGQLPPAPVPATPPLPPPPSLPPLQQAVPPAPPAPPTGGLADMLMGGLR